MDRVKDNLEAGKLAVEVLSGRVWTDHAPTMHAEVLSALASSGFDTRAEIRMPYWRCARGRIDIVAEYGGGGWVGIELDCRKPRLKSIAKLHGFSGYRIIGVRGIGGHTVEDIDACVAMRVHFASKAVKADRRIYRPPPAWAHDWRGDL